MSFLQAVRGAQIGAMKDVKNGATTMVGESTFGKIKNLGLPLHVLGIHICNLYGKCRRYRWNRWQLVTFFYVYPDPDPWGNE